MGGFRPVLSLLVNSLRRLIGGPLHVCLLLIIRLRVGLRRVLRCKRRLAICVARPQ